MQRTASERASDTTKSVGAGFFPEKFLTTGFELENSGENGDICINEDFLELGWELAANEIEHTNIQKRLLVSK